MIRLKKTLINLIVAGLMIVVLCGCSAINLPFGNVGKPENVKDSQYASNDEIELIEPAGSALSYVVAEKRDIYTVSTHSGMISPDSIEYMYDSDTPFGNYAALPGNEVSKGDNLFYGSLESYDDEIEKIEEENADKLAEHVDFVSDYLVDVAKARDNEYKAAGAYQDMCAWEPEDKESDAYSMWAKAALPAETAAKNAKMAREKMEQNYLETTELFDLDYAYNNQRIVRLQEKEAENSVTSGIDGLVVSSNYFVSGDNIPAGMNIMAVGNPNDKEIVCDFVSKSIITKAVDYYAIINGVRHEVTYENMEPEEYSRLMKLNDAVYSTFKIEDENNELPLGTFATVVVVEKMTKDVLCVPKGAVLKDDSGSFVYLYKDGESVYTPVQTGVFDNSFIEITYGLNEGDKIVFDVDYNVGTKKATITKGKVDYTFSTGGFLFYPFSEWVSNPAKNGTCYVKELCVSDYEQITKGQVLAKIEVVSDGVEAERIKRKLQRQQERLTDLYTKKQSTYNEDELITLDRAIRDRNQSIEDLNKQLKKVSMYSGIIELTAPYDGIVTATTDIKDGSLIGYREGIIQIAPDESSYIIVEDKEGLLSYGNEMTVTFKNSNGQSFPMTGMVANLSPYATSKDLRTGYSIIKISDEDREALSAAGSDLSNGYWSRNRYDVSGSIRSMDNVLLVPKNAVYKSGNDTYVITKDENGLAKPVKFVAGGSDNANYWVAYGDIKEGMEICLE